MRRPHRRQANPTSSVVHHIFLQRFDMGGPASGIDIKAIRLVVDHIGLGAQSVKNNGPETAVGTVQPPL